MRRFISLTGMFGQAYFSERQALLRKGSLHAPAVQVLIKCKYGDTSHDIDFILFYLKDGDTSHDMAGFFVEMDTVGQLAPVCYLNKSKHILY